MKSFNVNTIRSSVVLLLTLLMFSCKPKTVCIEDLKKANGTITSIDAPEHVDKGKQAILTVAVRNKYALCVKEANAYFTNVGLDSLLVTADLSYSTDPVPAGCECKRDSIIYTLLYFTPLNDGTYRIITTPDSSVTNVQPTDVLNLTIQVD